MAKILKSNQRRLWYRIPSKQMDKVKDATKELKDAQDKAKSDDDENVAKATTTLQDAIQNQSTKHHIQVGQLTVIPVKM